MHGQWWNPFKSPRRMLAYGSFWIVAGAVYILLTVARYASGVYAVLGGFWLVLALGYFVGAFQLRQSDRRDSRRMTSVNPKP